MHAWLQIKNTHTRNTHNTHTSMNTHAHQALSPAIPTAPLQENPISWYSELNVMQACWKIRSRCLQMCTLRPKWQQYMPNTMACMACADMCKFASASVHIHVHAVHMYEYACMYVHACACITCAFPRMRVCMHTHGSLDCRRKGHEVYGDFCTSDMRQNAHMHTRTHAHIRHTRTRHTCVVMFLMLAF